MKEKKMYTSPDVELMDIRLDSVIAASALTAPGFEDGGDLDLLF